MQALKGIPVVNWIKYASVFFIVASFLSVSHYKLDQFGDQALANQAELNELKEEMAAFTPSMATVQKTLEATREGMEELVRRMNDHDVEDSRREAEIGHNRKEIDRLRDEVN